MNQLILKTITFAVMFGIALTPVFSQRLDSSNYSILDPTVDSAGGAADSTNYSGLFSAGGTLDDARLESGNYKIGSGFPNGIQANVPLIRCAESTTDVGSTNCINFPNNNGAQGECGSPGCYDRFKFEIDHQNNPTDTLYLVSITDNQTSTEYFLKSDHTLDTTYTISDYQTICQLEGKDTRTGSGCENLSDPDWDETLQRYNVYDLRPGTEYAVKVRALHGDFTESQYSPTQNVTLEFPRLSIDIDIADSSGSGAETSAPYTINMGFLQTTPTTATNRIWLDVNANLHTGINLYVRDLHGGMTNGSFLIPSEDEDLAVDPNNNGGYGLKVDTGTETSLGPIISAPKYDTTNTHQVGALETVNNLIFSTNNTGSNFGPVLAGRASIMIKALITTSTISGIYTDTITLTMIANI